MGCIQKINYTIIRGEMYQGGNDRGEFTRGEMPGGGGGGGGVNAL